MVAISDDPSDYNALTPHFLIGGPLTQIAEPIVLAAFQNQIKSWELVGTNPKNFGEGGHKNISYNIAPETR